MKGNNHKMRINPNDSIAPARFSHNGVRVTLNNTGFHRRISQNMEQNYIGPEVQPVKKVLSIKQYKV